jgi:hypothetical protein
MSPLWYAAAMSDFSVLVPSNHRTRMRRRKVDGALSKMPVATARQRSSLTVVAVSTGVGARGYGCSVCTTV